MKLLKELTARDIAVAGGLVVLGWGCWLIHPPIAGIVVGGLLLLGGVAGYFMGTRK